MRRLHGPEPAPMILMYHRVASPQYDPWELAVTPKIFEEQLRYLKRHHTPMPLDDMMDGLMKGKLPRDAVAITFDDGYRDNLINARPLLALHQIPATVFLATGWMSSPFPYWWDELATLLLGANEPMEHMVVIDGERFLMQWSRPERHDVGKMWRAASAPMTKRQDSYLRLWRKLQRTTEAERIRAMVDLRRCLQAEHDRLSMPMDASEVRELVRGGDVTLGAHTASHPALTALTIGECRQEVTASAEACSLLTGRRISSFAYPYGDVDEAVRNVVAEAGFSLACTTRAAHLDQHNLDAFLLPRIPVRSCSISRFDRLTRF